jgi:hypothetical protein
MYGYSEIVNGPKASYWGDIFMQLCAIFAVRPDKLPIIEIGIKLEKIRILDRHLAILLIEGEISSAPMTGSPFLEGDKVYLTYNIQRMTGEIRMRELLDEKTTEEIVSAIIAISDRECASSEKDANYKSDFSDWPEGLIDYTRSLLGNVREMYKKWIADNPGYALAWFGINRHRPPATATE